MPHNDGTPEYWFDLALDDEKSARILARESASPDIAAYHFHQAVEKALKGLIAGSGGEVPRVHDLERLFKAAERLGIEFTDGDFDAIALIHSYYSDMRYPRGERLGPQDLDRIMSTFERLGFIKNLSGKQ